jgi:hypothetical protein
LAGMADSCRYVARYTRPHRPGYVRRPGRLPEARA